MPAASSSFVVEHLAIRRAVEDIIRRHAQIEAEYAADLPSRVLNLITAYNTELEALQSRIGEELQRRVRAEEHLRLLALDVDARIGAEHRANTAVALVKRGIVAPADIPPWDDGDARVMS